MHTIIIFDGKEDCSAPKTCTVILRVVTVVCVACRGEIGSVFLRSYSGMWDFQKGVNLQPQTLHMALRGIGIALSLLPGCVDISIIIV
jgi:hypothetical protein